MGFSWWWEAFSPIWFGTRASALKLKSLVTLRAFAYALFNPNFSWVLV